MNNLHEIDTNISYIQNLFLRVGYCLPSLCSLDEKISFLDNEALEYRSIGYESGAFEIAYQDLKAGLPLDMYHELYAEKGNLHPFHLQIGLGWAFAKAELWPETYVNPLPNSSLHLVYDGIGYYHALFKARRTVLGQILPNEVSASDRPGYDQGIGRRLWYICKGDVASLLQSIQSFDDYRQGDLWRGVGVACGYVGGSDRAVLEELGRSSANQKAALSTGFALAAYSRVLAGAVTESIALACEVACGMAVYDVLKLIPTSKTLLDAQMHRNWINQLETEFV